MVPVGRNTANHRPSSSWRVVTGNRQLRKERPEKVVVSVTAHWKLHTEGSNDLADSCGSFISVCGFRRHGWLCRRLTLREMPGMLLRPFSFFSEVCSSQGHIDLHATEEEFLGSVSMEPMVSSRQNVAAVSEASLDLPSGTSSFAGSGKATDATYVVPAKAQQSKQLNIFL